MRILGLDPGLRCTGWGVIDCQGNRLRHVADGAIRTEGDRLDLRVVTLYEGLQQVLDLYQPDEAAVEKTFINRNAETSLKLGQARGVVFLVPAQAGLAVSEYAATAVKKAVVGSGQAAKEQVMMMVRTLLPGSVLETSDAADALAVAVCHAHLRETGRRVVQRASGRGARP